MDLTGLSNVAQLGNEIITRIWPDASEADKAKLSLAMAELQAASESAKTQASVNQTEAASSSLFVSGWRPGLGWICVAALGYQFIIYPLLLWLTVWFPEIHAPAPIVSDMLWELMFGMLGLAGLRSWEKSKGVVRK